MKNKRNNKLFNRKIDCKHFQCLSSHEEYSYTLQIKNIQMYYISLCIKFTYISYFSYIVVFFLNSIDNRKLTVDYCSYNNSNQSQYCKLYHLKMMVVLYINTNFCRTGPRFRRIVSSRRFWFINTGQELLKVLL